MSSRGRKRNDNLPPSRAREVQRAFRARRKQHLAALEERIDVLETENARLRQMLSLPPSDRAPLGRGPTGREPARRGATPGASGSAPVAPPAIGMDMGDPGADAGPAASPPPISPGPPGRSPPGGAWPIQPPPPEWPLSHPPGPSAAVRAPSPYAQHLGTYHPAPGQRAEPPRY